MDGGYLYAFGAFLMIGSYMVPSRLSRAKGTRFLPYMALGLLGLEPFLYEKLLVLWAHPLWLGCSVLSGTLWAAGQSLANRSLEEVGLAKASVFFNVNSFINIALGIILFHEASGAKAYGFLLAGGILLFGGAWWVARTSAPKAKERDLRKGAALALAAGFFWGIYFIPIQAAAPGEEGLPLGSAAVGGMILGGALPILLLARRKGGVRWEGRDLFLGFLTAVLWIGGTLCFLRANQQLGLSRAVPIVNSSVLVYAGWSFYFKELPWAQWPRVFGGALAVVAGVVLMALSR